MTVDIPPFPVFDAPGVLDEVSNSSMVHREDTPEGLFAAALTSVPAGMSMQPEHMLEDRMDGILAAAVSNLSRKLGPQ